MRATIRSASNFSGTCSDVSGSALVDAGLRQVDFLDSEIAQVDQLIAADALGWPEVKRLMTVPGVNVIVAATFMAAVGDIRRSPTGAS